MTTPLPDPTELVRTGRPNDALFGPPDVLAATPDRETPVFDVSLAVLERAWLVVVRAAPRTEQLIHDSERRLYLFRQRSALFRFPDLISARFLSTPDARSTLALYSRSPFGHYDLGANRRRPDDWLQQLQRSLP